MTIPDFEAHSCGYCDKLLIESGHMVLCTIGEAVSASSNGCSFYKEIVHGKWGGTLFDGAGNIEFNPWYRYLSTLLERQPEQADEKLCAGIKLQRDSHGDQSGFQGFYIGDATKRRLCLGYLHPRSLFTFIVEDAAAQGLEEWPELYPRSNRSVNRIRHWLRNCEEQHADCRTRHSPQFSPRRLLHIEPILTATVLNIDEDATKPALKIKVVHSEAKGPVEQYAALSYCWGGKQPLTCNAHTVVDLQSQGLAATDLPQTLQDAVVLAYALGVKYLWIDSLCIMQDAMPADKAAEIAEMAQIFESADFTIAASKARSVYDGFLDVRNPDLWSRTIIKLRLAASDDRDIMLAWPQEPPHMDDSGGLGCHEFLPLSTRGWAYQERLLSRRIISFGRASTLFYCRDFRSHAPSDGVPAPRTPHPKGPHSMAVGTSPHERMHTGMMWRDVVREYSIRHFTFAEDRSIALSGIAERLSRFFKGGYMAGIWEAHFPDCLDWSMSGTQASGRRILPTADGAEQPSWSWTCLEIGQGSQLFWHNSSSIPTCSLSNYSCDLVSKEAPYGAVKSMSARLSVSGHILDGLAIRSMQYNHEDFSVYEKYAYGEYHYDGDRKGQRYNSPIMFFNLDTREDLDIYQGVILQKRTAGFSAQQVSEKDIRFLELYVGFDYPELGVTGLILRPHPSGARSGKAPLMMRMGTFLLMQLLEEGNPDKEATLPWYESRRPKYPTHQELKDSRFSKYDPFQNVEPVEVNLV